jgi:hypothetical protein
MMNRAGPLNPDDEHRRKLVCDLQSRISDRKKMSKSAPVDFRKYKPMLQKRDAAIKPSLGSF